MSQEELLKKFYNVIDSNFEEYEASGYDEEILSDLRNNIANSMLKTFKTKYGEESDFYNHSVMVYMTTINDCLKSYIKIPRNKRLENFHSYFLSTLTKAIKSSIRLERESNVLGITFGEETEKSSEARNTLRKISKLYSDLQKYNDFSSDNELLNEISILMGISLDEVKVYMPYVKKHSLSTENNINETEQTYSVIDIQKSHSSSSVNLEIPEDLMISRDNMKTILDKIQTVYKSDKFLSRVITFKILSSFEPIQAVKTNNTSVSVDCVSYLPSNYDFKELLESYNFIDKELLQDFFSGKFPEQKEIETSSGSVNNKWKQFIQKLLKKYRPDLEDIKEGLE